MGRRLENNPNHWSDIVGLPDDWDKQNIQKLINNFKAEKFNIDGKVITGQRWINLEVADAKKQHESDDIFNEYGIKSKESELRIGTAIPNVLWSRLQETIPSLFKDQRHFGWFVKNFPEFRVSAKF